MSDENSVFTMRCKNSLTSLLIRDLFNCNDCGDEGRSLWRNAPLYLLYVGLEKSDKMKDEKSLDLCGRLEKVEQSAGQVLD